MPASEIVTSTPEQARLWEGFVRSNPSRVVHALSLGFQDRPNPWCDTLAEFHPALDAVCQAAIDKDQRWQRLVERGVADVLCINVCSIKMKDYLRNLPSGSKDGQNIPSSFAKPMTVLLHAALKFSTPPDGTDLKVITALKRHWPTMVIRLLRDPENSLRREQPYTFERATPSKLFGRILVADPSFTSVLDNERDYTISLISRHWIYSSAPADILLNTMTLTDLVEGSTDALRVYRESHLFTPATFISIVQGVGSVANFISALAAHLNFYRGVDGMIEGSLLRNIWCKAAEGTHPLYTELLSIHRESVPLWTSIFSLLRRVATSQDGRNEGSIGVILPLVHHIANTVSHANIMGSVKECTDLINCWVTADLFGTLDIVVPIYAVEAMSFLDDLVADLARIFSSIDEILQKDQTLTSLLRSQFPRARLLRALIDLSHYQTPPGENKVSGPPCWVLFQNIERACVLQSECSRRDCDKKRAAQCKACKKVGYCGVECQRSDWQEHQRICKLKIERPAQDKD